MHEKGKYMKHLVYILSILLSKIFPLKKQVVFISFNGHYCDSPKALSEKLHEISPKTKILWLVSNNNKDILPPYVRCVELGEYSLYWLLQISSVIVDNTYCRKGFEIWNNQTKQTYIWVKLLSRKNQLLLSTWHGTPMKRMGKDVPGTQVTGFMSPNMTMVHGNQFVLDVMDRITFNSIHHELLGSPRNDILFTGINIKEIKERIGVPIQKKIILYAPTFRSSDGDVKEPMLAESGLNQIKELDFNKLFKTLTTQFGGDWVFVGRFHYLVEKEVTWESLHKQYPGQIINGNLLDDMADYLSCTDILLTDCSSCMFDFAVTKKPCFLYFPDVEHYQNNERDFYMDIHALPFPLATDSKGLIENIESFNESAYNIGLTELMEKIKSVDDGKSSERVVKQLILPHLQQK